MTAKPVIENFDIFQDTVQAFAQAVIRVLKDPTTAQQLRQHGRQTVVEKYNWQTIYSRWDKVYHSVGIMPAD